jgi:pseudouridine-5'-phosphate glycosidase
MNDLLEISAEVAEALAERRPVVALESSLIAHGLPWPINLETARQAEAAVRAEGGVPATIAVWRGRPRVGLVDAELEELAQGRQVGKVSRRDLPAVILEQATAATTVSATMALAHRAGIPLFATGGIGGVHRPAAQPGDVSADLHELARTPVAVVCAGAKSILDIPRTLEMLESLGVPVVGCGSDEFPAFYLPSSGERVSVRLDSPDLIARLLRLHWSLGGGGVVVAQPIARDIALGDEEFAEALSRAEAHAAAAGVRGPALTPFLLARLAEITQGKTLRANQELVLANARLAARIARHFLAA